MTAPPPNHPLVIALLVAACSAAALSGEPENAARADRSVGLGEASWTAQPSWLGNPADVSRCAARHVGNASAFEVSVPGRGMKWSWNLPRPVALDGYRYVAMRYRAAGLRSWADYAVCGLGTPRDGGPDYETLVPVGEIVADGRWHTVNVDLAPVAQRIPTLSGLAVQVQAVRPGALLEVSRLEWVRQRRPRSLADSVTWRTGARFDRFASISLGHAANTPSLPWRRRWLLADWFTSSEVTAEGVPFRLIVDGPDLAATTMAGKSELRLPVDQKTAEVYALLLADFTGSEEPAHGTGRLTGLTDVDRFRLRLEYADGTVDQCLPMDAATGRFGVGQGVQVVVAAADTRKTLKAIVLCDRTKQGAFALAALTVGTGPRCLFPAALDQRRPLLSPPISPEKPESAASPLEIRMRPTGPPILGRLIHPATGWSYLAEPVPLVKLRVDGQDIAAEDLQPDNAPSEGHADRRHWYQVGTVAGLRLGIDLQPSGVDAVRFATTIVNTGATPHTVDLTAPIIGPYRLGEEPRDTYYLFPQRGTVFDNRPCALRQPYSGMFPLQFVDSFNPSDRCGLALRTEDTDCLRREYFLEKAEDGAMRVGVEYARVILKPGDRFDAAPAVLHLTDGSWHRGFDAYRNWLHSWYRPVVPRRQWFREVFNFRQRFLWAHDPLGDDRNGTIDLEPAIDEAVEHFGGIDYLHLFDWGNVPGKGRLYGRTGDLSPFDRLADGHPTLRHAIGAAQRRGVPVGLYIEGYLLQENGLLGQKHGRQWQLIGPDGKGKYWPGVSEMFVCPAVGAWREVQASTYETKLRQLDVDGMYLDQFGFANRDKQCYATDHGHPVPSDPVAAERDCTRLVRRRIEAEKPGVALYSEEMPVDVTSQYQDGSFTYAMFSSQRTPTRVPLNMARFAVPDFKTIEILFCDRPTGSWATGVKWVFFNGEAIWLEGPAQQWFEPETLATVRRCYRILHAHRDAFTTLAPVPLVPTEQGGVFANAFPIDGKTVVTLYNARHRTVRGPVLRIPHIAGTTYHDAWNDRPAEVRHEGPTAIVSLEIGPHDVGCLVVEHEK